MARTTNATSTITQRVPLMVALLLLALPSLYTGSYSALVQPAGRIPVVENKLGPYTTGRVYHYRLDGEWPELVFWPMEQVDRGMRPAAWNDNGILPFPLP